MIARVVLSVTDGCHVENLNMGPIIKACTGHTFFITFSGSVPFDGSVWFFVLNGEEKLQLSVITFVKVERVVSNIGNREVFCVDCTTEELDAVVQVSEYFNIFNGGSGSHASEGQTVDFISVTDCGTPMTDRYIFKSTRTIWCIIITIRVKRLGDLSTCDIIGRNSLNRVAQWQGRVGVAFSIRVDRSFTQNDQSTPETFIILGKVRSSVQNGGENNGIGSGTYRFDLCTLRNDQGWCVVSGTLVRFDGRTCLDC